MTGGGESSPSFKACVKMNIETRSVCVCMRVCVYARVCVHVIACVRVCL